MSKPDRLRQTLGRWFAVPWYPILFSAYPVLALMAFNVGQTKVEAGIRALLACISLAAILSLLCRLILRDWSRASFLSTLWLILFFSYGHVDIQLTNELKDVDFERWLLIAWAVLAVLSLIWAVKKSPAPFALNVVVLGLVVMSLWQVSSGVQKGGVHRVAAKNAPVDEHLTRPQHPPDVYYFIVDMYTRQDLLKTAFGYDNSPFIQDLESRGFYVAQCSQSNYTRTELSLASSLNLSFLQGLDPKFDDPKSIGRGRLWDALKHSAARFNFENLGYKTISFANGFPWSELDDADVFISPPPLSSGLNEFETLFLQTTLARLLQDFGWLDLDQISGQNFRDRDYSVFNGMRRVVKMPGPKFVYVHLILPHPPFVFAADGSHTDPADFWNERKVYPWGTFKIGYINQTAFLNTKLLAMIDTILAGSTTPPIIVIQGDNGPWIQPNPQHFFILNAYYLPGNEYKLYPKISPVNTFRLIFDSYFGGHYGLLPDISYYSPVPKLYDFSEVKNNCSFGGG